MVLCKGCNTPVAKPVSCRACGVSSHPACLVRACDKTGQNFENGHFIDCRPISPTQGETSVNHETLLRSIKTLISDEFAKFRELYNADMDRINLAISDISGRVATIESKISTMSVPCEEDMLIELKEREKRSCNIIVRNMEEPNCSLAADQKAADVANVMKILETTHPVEPSQLKVTRLGTKKNDHTRPICVTFPNSETALSVLRNKCKYNGPCILHDDRTPKQRQYLQNLRDELKNLEAAGVLNKTIRYVHGTPKIVNKPRQSSKN